MEVTRRVVKPGKAAFLPPHPPSAGVVGSLLSHTHGKEGSCLMTESSTQAVDMLVNEDKFTELAEDGMLFSIRSIFKVIFEDARLLNCCWI